MRMLITLTLTVLMLTVLKLTGSILAGPAPRLAQVRGLGEETETVTVSVSAPVTGASTMPLWWHGRCRDRGIHDAATRASGLPRGSDGWGQVLAGRLTRTAPRPGRLDTAARVSGKSPRRGRGSRC